MVISPLFSDKIAIMIDNTCGEDYDFACLTCAENGLLHRIKMSKNVYYDIKRGKPYARMILLHELGHYFQNHHLVQNKQRDKERSELVSNGKLSEEELKADAFAVEFLGIKIVERGLEELYALIDIEYKQQENCDASLTLRELNMRREKLLTQSKKT